MVICLERLRARCRQLMPLLLTQFFTGRMPFLPPNLQHQSTEGNIPTHTYTYRDNPDKQNNQTQTQRDNPDPQLTTYTDRDKPEPQVTTQTHSVNPDPHTPTTHAPIYKCGSWNRTIKVHVIQLQFGCSITFACQHNQTCNTCWSQKH